MHPQRINIFIPFIAQVGITKILKSSAIHLINSIFDIC